MAVQRVIRVGFDTICVRLKEETTDKSLQYNVDTLLKKSTFKSPTEYKLHERNRNILNKESSGAWPEFGGL